jgi:hypothetical protein
MLRPEDWHKKLDVSTVSAPNNAPCRFACRNRSLPVSVEPCPTGAVAEPVPLPPPLLP